MKIQILFLVVFGIFLITTLPQVFAEENSSLEELSSQILIDFSVKNHWDGLDTSSDYWEIIDDVGHFYLKPNTAQIEAAVYDIRPFLDDDVNDEWMLQYDLKINDYVQSTSDSWAELLIGLSDNSSNAITDQWGVGIAFLNGAELNLTHVMYDQGSYNKWHCCPVKAKFESNESLLSSNTSFFIEYIKMESEFIVRISDENKNLIEQQTIAIFDSSPNLRYLKIFPLIEDETVDGLIQGEITNIIFSKNLDNLEFPELISEENSAIIVNEITPFVEKPLVGNWIKNMVNSWVSDELSDSEFFEKIVFLIENDSKLIPYLSDYENFDDTYKSKTYSIPQNPICLTCVAEKYITLKWKLPPHVSEKGTNFEVNILTPKNELLKFVSSEKNLLMKITNNFTPGLYHTTITYGVDEFEMPAFLLIPYSDHIESESIPFWVKNNLNKWVLDKVSDDEFFDSIKFLLKKNKISLEKSILENTEESKVSHDNPLEYVFPTNQQINTLRPQVWEYFGNVTSAKVLGEYSSVISAQKTLSDYSREFDPIYNKHKVPFSLLQVFKFETQNHAKEFLESQAFWTDVNSINNAQFYNYDEILTNGDSYGTSSYTGDCLYKYDSQTSMDETHVIICIKGETLYQIFLYEDYPSIDSSLVFSLMDMVLMNDTVETLQIPVDTLLKLKNIRDAIPIPPSLPPPVSESFDPETSSSQIGISNFSCVTDDFGFVNMTGTYLNGELSSDNVIFDIVIEGYAGDLLAFGQGKIENLSPFESRNFSAYVHLDEPFYKCDAVEHLN